MYKYFVGLILFAGVANAEINYSTFLSELGPFHHPKIALDNQGNLYLAGGDHIIKASPGMDILDEFEADVGISDIAVDNQGNIYLAGGIYAAAAVSKLTPEGELIYSIPLGGRGWEDYANAVAFDDEGNAYVAGSTDSDDFPIVNAFQPQIGGHGALNPSSDAFIAKISPEGEIPYSTYLGGEGGEVAWGLVVDGEGNATVVGQTSSQVFPTTEGALKTERQGLNDAFISRFNPQGQLIYSTLLGGSGADIGQGIAMDEQGSFYVMGRTVSQDFPLRFPLQRELRGRGDYFITKLTQGRIAYSTYLGGNGFEQGFYIDVNDRGEAFVGGTTSSTDFPLANPLQSQGNSGAFVAQLSAQGNRLLFSSYIGQGANLHGLKVDQNQLYLSGRTGSPDFPTTADAWQTDIGPGAYPASARLCTKSVGVTYGIF
jgi:hypothetical protein